jgi:hypothetical protein
MTNQDLREERNTKIIISHENATYYSFKHRIHKREGFFDSLDHLTYSSHTLQNIFLEDVKCLLIQKRFRRTCILRCNTWSITIIIIKVVTCCMERVAVFWQEFPCEGKFTFSKCEKNHLNKFRHWIEQWSNRSARLTPNTERLNTGSSNIWDRNEIGHP